MNKQIKLNTIKINELGDYISSYLHDCGVTNFDLNIKVKEHDFKKIDEDLFYTINKNNLDDLKFEPSNDMITIEFINGNINIIKADI